METITAISTVYVARVYIKTTAYVSVPKMEIYASAPDAIRAAQALYQDVAFEYKHPEYDQRYDVVSEQIGVVEDEDFPGHWDCALLVLHSRDDHNPVEISAHVNAKEIL